MKKVNKRKRIVCMFLGHKESTHLDLIYGSLLREHKICSRCDKTLYFERCTEERAEELTLIDCF